MINRVTGEIEFGDGLRIVPHCTVDSLFTAREKHAKVQTQKLSLGDWKRHVLGSHPSEHGTLEVEALSADDDCIHVVLLSHQHRFYEAGTPEDAERRAFHEGWSTQITGFVFATGWLFWIMMIAGVILLARLLT